MSRRMSCSMTVDAVRYRTKTVTRRRVDTWRTLKPGDRLTLIEKGMGLPKGSQQVVLCDVEVTDVRVERLGDMAGADCELEGFPDLTPFEFMLMWARSHGYTNGFKDGPLHELPCRRIEWRYLEMCDGCCDHIDGGSGSRLRIDGTCPCICHRGAA